MVVCWATEYYEKWQSLIKDTITALDKYFEEDGRWYEKNGLIGDECTMDVAPCLVAHDEIKEVYPKKLRLKGDSYWVPSVKGKELSPQMLHLLCVRRGIIHLYSLPLVEVVDHQLVKLVPACRQYAFEKNKERFGEAYLKSKAAALDSGWLIGHIIEELKKKDYALPFNLTFDVLVKSGLLYSSDIPADKDPGLIERNRFWIQRLVKLNEEKFKLAFAHVGLRHLHDLFEKLNDVGFTVSERVSLAKLDEILLDKDCVVAEHAARKTAMKAAFAA